MYVVNCTCTHIHTHMLALTFALSFICESFLASVCLYLVIKNYCSCDIKEIKKASFCKVTECQ